MAGEHPCAAPGCTVLVAHDKLMCTRHWFALPKGLQVEVNRTWHRYRRDPESYREAREKAVAWHRDHSSNPNTQGSMF